MRECRIRTIKVAPNPIMEFPTLSSQGLNQKQINYAGYTVVAIKSLLMIIYRATHKHARRSLEYVLVYLQ